MIIEGLTVGPFQENCYVLACEETRHGVLIDPGGEAEEILEMVRRHDVEIRDILLTHAHVDHVGAVQDVRKSTGAKVHLCSADLQLYQNASRQASMFGLRLGQPAPPDAELADGQTLACGKLTIRVLATPGHSPGGVCFFVDAGDPTLFSGDTLFAGSIGRTDLWGGSLKQLLDSIREKLFPLGRDVRVYPGHGEPTTIGEEIDSNPFLQGGAFADSEEDA